MSQPLHDSIIDDFARRVQKVDERVKQLVRTTTPHTSSSDSLEDLSTALEELRVAEEELRQQHEALIQARYDIEQEHRRYLDLFESAPDGYIVTSPTGQMQEVNRVASRMFNVEATFLVGKPLSMYFSKVDRAAFGVNLITSLSGKGSAEWEVRIQPRNGHPFDAALTMTAMYGDNSEIRALRWAVRDITERKAIENQIKLLNAQLEARVEERTHQLRVETRLKEAALQQETAARREAEALRDSALLLTSTLDLGEVLNRVFENIRQVVPHDAAQISLVEAGQVKVVRLSGYQEKGLNVLHDSIARLVLTVDTFPLSRMIETREPFILLDWQARDFWLRIPSIEHIRSFLGTPILINEEVLGFLMLVGFEPNAFTEVHARQLQAFAAQAATAIHNARYYEHSREVAAQEERQRIARDLHDEVSQTLFSAEVFAQGLLRMELQDGQETKQRLQQLHGMIRGALAELRTMFIEMRPSALLHSDLAELLRQLTEAMQSRKRLVIHLNAEKEMILPPNVKITFYRVAQEALNNVLKHSRATEVKVALMKTDEPKGLLLCVEDNGRGFDPHLSVSGMGLGMMQERAESINAALVIRSTPGEGAAIQLRWTV
ncbi:MAG: GAF domain-containing protein [bacterium]|nr:GAF domain-containing protein [bacterium]